MPQNQVASGTCDRHVNPADGVGSLTNASRTHQAHAEGRLDYKGAEPGRPKWKSKLRTSGVTDVAYQPCIDDPEHIRAVEGERYVVLRPGTPLSGVHNELQSLLRQRFADEPISFPVGAHVTLAGFAAGTSLSAVQALVESWSRRVSALRITVEGLSCFPKQQIVFARVLKTLELLDALSQLRRDADQARLDVDTAIAKENWVFHMSVGYCSKLGESAWRDVTALVEQQDVAPTFCDVSDVEVIAFDGHREYSGGVHELRGRWSARASDTRA